MCPIYLLASATAIALSRCFSMRGHTPACMDECKQELATTDVLPSSLRSPSHRCLLFSLFLTTGAARLAGEICHHHITTDQFLSPLASPYPHASPQPALTTSIHQNHPCMLVSPRWVAMTAACASTVANSPRCASLLPPISSSSFLVSP